jgi:pimeloyl-ACP methyl ester carboxylesterase
MLRLVRAIVAIVLVLVAAAGVAYVVKNPETATLDTAARAGATGRFVSLSDGVTHYEVQGPDTGRVAVLVHGFSVPYYIWDSTAIALHAAGYRVIRYDVFGRGLSDRPDVAYDGALYDRQLLELLDSLHVSGPVDLMGLSYGGYVTGHFAATHAKRVRTLTLVDPVAGPRRSIPSMLTLPLIGPWFWQVAVAPKQADGQLTDFLHPERWPDWVAQYRPQMRYRGFGRALLRSSITSARTDYAAHYAAVGATGVPVLLIWGKQDSTVSISNSHIVRGGIPGIDYLVVDSAGHLPALEQSGLVHAKMLAFLAAHPVTASQ